MLDTGIVYGYARCSTKKQDPQRQFRNISSVCSTVRFFFDAYTGTKMDGRKDWQKLMKLVKPGDTIIFDSVSRMSRNAEEGVAEYKRLYTMGVHLKFIKEPHIDTSVFEAARTQRVPMTGTSVDLILEGINNYLMAVAEQQIILAFQESEREVLRLRERTREGIVTAKAKGKRPGRKENAKVITKRSIYVKQRITELSKEFDGNLKDKDIIELLHVGHNTYYKYKNELKEQQKALLLGSLSGDEDAEDIGPNVTEETEG